MSIMSAMMSSCQTGYEESGDILCKTLLQQLLKEQSVVNVAASLDTERSLYSRRGTPIVGRNSRVSERDELIPSPTPENPTAMALLQSYLKERSTSSSAFPTSHPLSAGSRKLERTVSLPIEDSVFSSKSMSADRYKTELCRQFQETGFCKYGAKCQFAHGFHELRCVSRHPRYKTEMCRTYHLTGICPYGARCHFVHDDEEVNPKQREQATRKTSLSTVSSTRRSSGNFNPAVGSFMDMHRGPGSIGETPPSSISSSPAPSPTMFKTDDVPASLSPAFVRPPPGFSALPTSAPPAISGVFNFHEYLTASAVPMTPSSHGTTSPLCVDIKPSSAFTSGYPMQNYSSPSSSCFSDFMVNPPTPPMSYDDDTDSHLCGSPMDISRNLRLPVFSHLSK